jgi:hypothetical protein
MVKVAPISVSASAAISKRFVLIFMFILFALPDFIPASHPRPTACRGKADTIGNQIGHPASLPNI